MISVVNYVETYKHRAAGWVQDASSFSNLHRFVSAFSQSSVYRYDLLNKIQRLVADDLAQHFQEVLDQVEINLTYQDIVGSAPAGSRKHETVCNGIGQAALKGQKREYQGDWPTNNFLRWAESLQFVVYSPADDTYKITVIGEEYVKAQTNAGQYQLVKQQLAMYSPAVRVLALLDTTEHTKFTLGEQLGFIGEKGFTNISEKLFIDIYFASSSEDRIKLRSDYEGSSDKYARQICSWLISLGLAETIEKRITRDGETLGLQAYKITPQGKEFLRKARITAHRFVPFGMLSLEDSNKELICKRRALVLKALSEGSTSRSAIISAAQRYDIAITDSEADDDILSLQNIGLSITSPSDGSYQLKDTIDGLYIPRLIAPTALSKVLAVKEMLRGELKHIDHSLLVLIDFAYGSKRTARLLEVYVARVYQQIYQRTFLLGGASKPDVVVCADKFVLIADAKAYSGGFPIPQAERDKMVRYIKGYQDKTSLWYRLIESGIKANVPIFQFVSSEFNGSAGKLADISQRTGAKGSAVTAEDLLRLIDDALSKKSEINIDLLTSNQQIGLMVNKEPAGLGV